MSLVTAEEQRIKELVKQALLELIEERKDLLYDSLAEALEDVALVKAIKEGEASEPVGRAEVFRILEGRA
ncbi:MAG: hypothetical protein FJ279_12775 [Planctomycetes bacterium]|nr:hypothetical protein [Planctomycetota bacterium]MBM4084909.1 hypothetical protein [Planctomycetota bacterium]